MKMSVKRGSKGVYGKRARALSRALDRLGREGARDGEAHARRSLAANVYSTAPGNRYRRTGHLLSQIYSAGHGNATSLGILLGDQATYASEVEYGTGPYELSPAQLEAYLVALPPGSVLSFGRSGLAYMLPGPYIGPGLRFAQFKTHERLRALLQQLWS